MGIALKTRHFLPFVSVVQFLMVLILYDCNRSLIVVSSWWLCCRVTTVYLRKYRTEWSMCIEMKMEKRVAMRTLYESITLSLPDMWFCLMEQTKYSRTCCWFWLSCSVDVRTSSWFRFTGILFFHFEIMINAWYWKDRFDSTTLIARHRTQNNVYWMFGMKTEYTS